MMSWKRTLAWALCASWCAWVGAVAAVAEEPSTGNPAQAEVTGAPDVSTDLDVQSASGPAAATADADAPADLEEPGDAAAPPDPAADASDLDVQSAASPSEATADADADAAPELEPLVEDTEDTAGAPADTGVADTAATGAGDAEPSDASSLDADARSLLPIDPDATAPLGAVGYDSEGRQGRIHLVVRGDTLWDISSTYLGTPWVWPSIWTDNDEIENPHVIHPGDRIWITPSEMRRITAEEAAVLLSNAPDEAPAEPAAPDEPLTVADESGSFEEALSAPTETRSYRVSARESAGLISPEELTSSASVVGSVPDRVLLGQEDQVYIGLGEAEVEPGDEFTLFRTKETVFDPDTGKLLGYHVDILGWARVQESFPGPSLASIRMSTGEIGEGDRVTPREPLPPEIEIQSAPTGVEGKISFFPGRRVLMGFQDFVYLNRGSLDGIEIGSPLEVYRPGYRAFEDARQERVEVPERVVAKLLVVRAETDSSVALVTATEDELELGDLFRGATE